MIDTVKNEDVKVILMHNLGVPANKNEVICNTLDPVKFVYEWFEKRILELEKCGIERERVIIDPGIGFGKTSVQSLKIIKSINKYKKLKTEIMIGHSRKSFLTLFTEKKAEERDLETFIFSEYLARHKVDYIRVHNVEGNLRAIKLSHHLNN